jgi:Ion transport protein
MELRPISPSGASRSRGHIVGSVRGGTSAGGRLVVPDGAARPVAESMTENGVGPSSSRRDDPLGRALNPPGLPESVLSADQASLATLVPAAAAVAPYALRLANRALRHASVHPAPINSAEMTAQRQLLHGHLMRLISDNREHSDAMHTDFDNECIATGQLRAEMHPYHLAHKGQDRGRSISLDRRPRMPVSAGSFQSGRALGRQGSVLRNSIAIDRQLQALRAPQSPSSASMDQDLISSESRRSNQLTKAQGLALGLASALGSSAESQSQRQAIVGALKQDLNNLARMANGPTVNGGLATSAVYNPLFSVLTLPASQTLVDRLQPHLHPLFQMPPGHVLLSHATAHSLAQDLCTRSQTVTTVSEEGVVAARVLWMGETASLRRCAIAVTRHPSFDQVMVVAILLSCVAMALEGPHVVPGSKLDAFLFYNNLVLTVVFAVELVLKLLTYGLLGYWKKFSNRIDAIIVIFSFLLIALEDSGLAFAKPLRLLRVLKAARIATRSENMQKLITSILSSISSMLNVTLILMMAALIFAILGVQLYSGLFYFCNDNSVANVNECQGKFMLPDGSMEDRQWLRPFYNFDNLGQALLSLFVTMTLDGWCALLQQVNVSRRQFLK